MHLIHNNISKDNTLYIAYSRPLFVFQPSSPSDHSDGCYMEIQCTLHCMWSEPWPMTLFGCYILQSWQCTLATLAISFVKMQYFMSDIIIILYHFDQLFGHMSQGCPKRRVCLFVTGHATFWRQWQLIFGAFRPKILPKMAISKRFSSCHAAWRRPKSCASLRGSHRSQAAKTWSKWYSISYWSWSWNRCCNLWGLQCSQACNPAMVRISCWTSSNI